MSEESGDAYLVQEGPDGEIISAASGFDDYEGRARRSFSVDPPPSSKVWLISFTDIMALMLTFFVLLFSMSEPEKEGWESISKTLQSQFNKFQGAEGFHGAYDAMNVARIHFDQALDLSYLKLLIERLVEKDERLTAITLTSNPKSLVISLPDELLFEAGKTELSEKGSDALFSLAGILSRIKNRTEIIGHTDPRPVSENASFSSNWELSLSRAFVVAGVLQNLGYGEPVTVRGLSSGRYRDLPENLSEEEKWGIARRVDIVLMKDDGKKSTFGF